MRSFLAIDFGTKRLGFAAAEDGRVHPIETWARRTWVEDVARIRAILEERALVSVLVGIPTMLDGRASSATERASRFIDALRGELGTPVETWDEALTSHEADARMEDAGLSDRDRTRWRDAYAAAVLAEDYILHHGKTD